MSQQEGKQVSDVGAEIPESAQVSNIILFLVVMKLAYS